MGLGKGILVTILSLTMLALVLGACAPAAAPAATPGATTAAKPATAAAPTTTSAAKPTAAATVAATPAAQATPVAKAATPALDKPLDPPVTVKVGMLQILSAINMYTAVEKGFFKAQGLNVDFSIVSTGAQLIPPLSTGELQVGAGATSAGFFNAIQRGLPIKIVADWNSGKTPSTLIFVARKDLVDSGTIKDYADLKGKTVSINASGNYSDIVLDQILKKGGLTLKDINLQIVPFDQVPIAMANKSIDVGLTNEPYVTVGIQQGTLLRWKDVNDLEPGREYSNIFYSPQFARDNPEAAKRWALAYLQGVRYYQTALKTPAGKAEMINLLNKYIAPQSQSFYDQMVFPYSNPDGYVNDKSVTSDLDWYVTTGQVKDKPDLKTVIDHSFMEYAVSKLGKFQP